MTAALTPGATFAGLRIEEVIGRGGMGVVYRAFDAKLQRPVALKLIAPELAGDERFRRRFLREPRVAASLEHPHVVPVHDAGELDGTLYLVMRLVEGGDLRSLLRQRPDPERLLRILAQIASALDAAHRRGLVHRDVKPANILLDEDEHAYLTDFGITKELGDDSTGSGRLVGTLEYLAPEQIRGEAVDGRTDQYALACVLYEGIAGSPPFRRRTEAEMLWAHMQEDPPPVRPPELDAVLRRGLAKEPGDRYASCAELIGAARDAPRLPAPPVAAPARRRGRVRRRLALAGAALSLVAGGAGALALISGDDNGGEAIPTGSGVASFDESTGRFASLTRSETTPSNVAVGEGAIWALSTDERTVAKIDPATRRVLKRFQIGGIPSDIAAGEGAVWIGRGGGSDGNSTVSVVRVDPRTTRVTHTTRLRAPKDASGWPSVGYPGIAVGAGAVWAINPDASISRIDPVTGDVVARIDAEAGSIAAGDAGVWFVSGSSVSRIDPSTNGIGETIEVGANQLAGIAVGADSVWATGDQEGLLWRIQPEPPKAITRSIEVGPGVSYVAFGGGAVWATSYIDGRISRIDPRTNRVTAQVPIGAAQSLAAGMGAAWVSVAGEPPAGALPASCDAVVSAGGEPDVLIASDLPLQGPTGGDRRPLADAIRLILRQHGFRAGRFTVGYASCDSSTAQSGVWDFRRCAANAKGYAGADRLLALIGPYNSQCAEVQLPILNRARGGPLATISPSNTSPGLTRPVSDTAYRNEPDVFYPTGVRHYVRLGTAEDLTGAADAIQAKRLGLKSAYLLDDGEGPLDVLVTDSFRYAAGKLGIRITGEAQFSADASSYDALARRVARSGAECVVIGGSIYGGAARLVKALRARVDDDVVLMSGSYAFHPVRDALERAGRAAHGMYLGTVDTPAPLAGRGQQARELARELGTPQPAVFALEAAQAADLVLDAIARSDGTRLSVVRELRRSVVEDGILGSFRFDRNGDITPARVSMLRITGSAKPGSELIGGYNGAVLERIIEVPTDLQR